MKKENRTAFAPILAALVFGLGLFVSLDGEAQVRLMPSPVPEMTISAECQSDRAVFKIRNGQQEWAEMGEIIVLSEQERRIVSRREMRFTSNQTASYRVPLTGISAAKGPLRVVLMSGGAQKKPIAQARLDCANG